MVESIIESLTELKQIKDNNIIDEDKGIIPQIPPTQ